MKIQILKTWYKIFCKENLNLMVLKNPKSVDKKTIKLLNEMLNRRTEPPIGYNGLNMWRFFYAIYLVLAIWCGNLVETLIKKRNGAKNINRKRP